MFRYIFYSFFIVFLFTSCTNAQKNLDYSTREYNGISKDAILNAAKRVIKLSDEDFTISSRRNSISVIRAIPKNKGFTIDININELELNTTTENEKTIAKLVLKHKDDLFSDNQTILKGSPHELFWDRVDYILGLKQSWYSCTKYRLLLNFDGFFCDIKYNSNIYPSEYDLIKDTAISKPVVLVEDSISLAKIDLSTIEGILLPLKNPQKETIVTIADLNTSGLFDLNETNDNNQTINKEDTILDDNSSNIFIPEINSTILEYIEQPLPDETNETLNDKKITVLDINASIIELATETNTTMVIDTPQIMIEKNLASTNIQSIEIIDNNETLTPQSTIEDTIIPNTEIKEETKIQLVPSMEEKKSQLSNFGKKFMESDSKTHYTINLATAYTKEQSDKLIDENNIKTNSFAIGFINDTDNKYYIKIMYGVYKSKEDAQEALKNLPPIFKANRPTIESVGRKQDLFNKKGEDLSVQ